MKILVPATTSNLASGFDVLGMALDIYLEVDFELNSKGFVIKGCDSQYCNEDNLIIKGIKKVFDIYNKDYWQKIKNNLSISIKTDIPIARGLGSSASCIAAGLVFANQYLYQNKYENKLTNEQLIKLGTELEGHPDNISAAILGGITASWYDKENDKVYATKINFDYNFFNNFNFFVLIPDFEVKTEHARNILPKEVEFKDVVFNLSKLGLLFTSIINKDENLFSISFDDRLHQKYRSKLIFNYDQIIEMANSSGAIANFISGSGSSIICVSKKEENDFESKLKKGLNEIKEKYQRNWQIKKVNINQQGVKILEN